ncbi:MAG TPA: ABC transporter permease [Herpetosiphonaceae bacterium]
MAVIQETSVVQAERSVRQRERLRLFGLLLPGTFWLVAFFLLPLVMIVIYSFLRRSSTGDIDWIFSFDNYVRLFTSPLYLSIFWRSFWLAIVTTLICLLIGYPLAFFIARQNERWRAALIFGIMIPFWTNFLVRIYAWQFLLNNTGLINSVLDALGFDTLNMINTTGAVLTGLVYGELPFMVLPLYAVLERFDWRLLEAAEDLYANRARAFWHVMLPLTMPGITAGSILVFVPTVGQFVVPELLGGSKVAVLGNQLATQFKSAQNAPFGSAIALVFMALLTLAVMIYFRATTEESR